MNKENKNIKQKNTYFSGQGTVSLKKISGDEVFDLGNCKNLVVYKNGQLAIVWESLSEQNIELLLGDLVEEDEHFKKYKIKRSYIRKFILTFRGFNTADNNRIITLEAEVFLDLVEFIPMINDGLAAFVTYGEWVDDISLGLAVDSKNTDTKTSSFNTKYTAEEFKLSKSGKFIKFLQYNDLNKSYNVLSAFNPNSILKIEAAIDGLNNNKTIITFTDNSTITLPFDIQYVLNYIERLGRSERELNHHTEKESGYRPVDYVYERSDSNKIKFEKYSTEYK